MKKEGKVSKNRLEGISGGTVPEHENTYVKNGFYKEFETTTLRQESKDVFAQKNQMKSQLNQISQDFDQGKISKGKHAKFLEDLQDLEDQFEALNIELALRTKGNATVYK